MIAISMLWRMFAYIEARGGHGINLSVNLPTLTLLSDVGWLSILCLLR